MLDLEVILGAITLQRIILSLSINKLFSLEIYSNSSFFLGLSLVNHLILFDTNLDSLVIEPNSILLIIDDPSKVFLLRLLVFLDKISYFM